MKKLNQKGIATTPVFVLSVVIAVVGFAGWRVLQTYTDVEPENASIGNNKEEPKPAKEIPQEITYKKYESDYQQISFEYPTSWHFKEIDLHQGQKDKKQVFLTSPGGLQLTYNDEIGGLGGGCSDSVPNVVLDNVEPLSGAGGVHIVESMSGLALTGEYSQNGETEDCIIFLLVPSKLHGEESRMSFGTSPQFRGDDGGLSESQKGDLKEARKILKSFTY